MTLKTEATYENGTVKLAEPLPLKEHEKVQVTNPNGIKRARQTPGLVTWTGTLEDLDYLIEDVENDPLETP